MATQSTQSKNRQGSGSGAARDIGRAGAGANSQAASSSSTSQSDETYGLVSVLYHSLQGAETYAKYVKDAQQSGDQELIQFFEECRRELDQRALRARQLLAMRLAANVDEDDDDEDDDDDDES